MTTSATSTEQWWATLRGAALVGTARRPVPAPMLLAGVRPASGERHDAAADLLDAAAVATGARRAGRRATRGPQPPDPATPDVVPVATGTAAQLLGILLRGDVDVYPVETLMGDWLAACARSGRRVPTGSVVALLDRGTATRELRPAIAAVAGERARWLAGLNPMWSWLVAESVVPGPAPVTPDDWARLSDTQRLAVLRARRRHDPDGALGLLRTTWDRDPASVRAAHLGVLGRGRAPGDEALLDAALDDRARSVREAALHLLDGRGDSARAGRMADRLAPLVSVEGTRRSRRIVVTWPDDAEPDDAAIRDGLGTPPAGRSARAWWLRRLAAGAPLAFWAERVGAGPADVVAAIDDDDVIAGLTDAVVARRDERWAASLFGRTRWPNLLAAVPPPEREALVSARLAQPVTPPELGALLSHLDNPWSAPFSIGLVDVLRAHKHPSPLIDAVPGGLGAHLHADAFIDVERWLRDVDEHLRLARQLRMILQFESFRRSITEAFR